MMMACSPGKINMQDIMGEARRPKGSNVKRKEKRIKQLLVSLRQRNSIG
jgi:hypothetical protein